MSATTKETAVDSREPAPKKVKSDNAPSTKGTVSGCKKVTDVDETSQAPACKPTKGKCKLEPKKEPVEYGSQPMDFGSTESDSGAEYSEDEELRAEIDAAIESISNGSRSPEVIELSSDDMDTTSTVVQTKRKTPERPKKRFVIAIYRDNLVVEWRLLLHRQIYS